MKHIIIYVVAVKMSTVVGLGKLLFNNTVDTVIDIVGQFKNRSILIHQGKIIDIKMHQNRFFDRDFIKKVLTRFTLVQSSEKILVLSGHGSGWFMHDDHTKHIVRLNHFRQGLQELNIKLDLLVFDCCFGAGIEIIYEFRDCTKYILASQEYMYEESLISGLIYLLGDAKLNKNKKYDKADKDKIKNKDKNKIKSAFKFDMDGLKQVAKDYIKRGNRTREPTTVTVIDVAVIVPLIKRAMMRKWTIDDFNAHRGYIIDDCESWLAYCKKCDSRECDIFYDFKKIMLDVMNAEFIDEFDAGCMCFMTRYCLTKGTGINFSIFVIGGSNLSSPLFNELYRELTIHADYNQN